jgi:hypothetical protein
LANWPIYSQPLTYFTGLTPASGEQWFTLGDGQAAVIRSISATLISPGAPGQLYVQVKQPGGNSYMIWFVSFPSGSFYQCAYQDMHHTILNGWGIGLLSGAGSWDVFVSGYRFTS